MVCWAVHSQKHDAPGELLLDGLQIKDCISYLPDGSQFYVYLLPPPGELLPVDALIVKVCVWVCGYQAAPPTLWQFVHVCASSICLCVQLQFLDRSTWALGPPRDVLVSKSTTVLVSSNSNAGSTSVFIRPRRCVTRIRVFTVTHRNWPHVSATRPALTWNS